VRLYEACPYSVCLKKKDQNSSGPRSLVSLGEVPRGFENNTRHCSKIFIFLPIKLLHTCMYEYDDISYQDRTS
jgi:hypothetical protein